MTNETVTHLLLEQLHESPFNPRLTFDAADLDELAESIRTVGILQPIVARPIVKPGKEHQFEIIFGHRRYRAAEMAGYPTAPTIVRALSDEEAALAQIHENLKRKDVHAIEEALGYVRLMSDHGYSIANLIQNTGKSKSYIYARLKLAQLGDAARAACLRGELDAETGVLIARYCRAPKLQERALKLVTVEDNDSAGTDDAPKRKPISHRLAKMTLRNEFCILITDAPFDSTDATLRKTAGACTTCPKRAGNDPELADLSDKDICTDRECFNAKCLASAQLKIAAAKKNEQPVVEGDEARKLLPRANVLRAILERVRSTRRTTEESRLIVRHAVDTTDELGEDIEAIFGWQADLESADNPTAVLEAKVATMGPSDLAALLVMVAIESMPYRLPCEGAGVEGRAQERLALAKRYGVDVLAAAWGTATPAVDGGQDDAERDTKTIDMFAAAA